jgi:hypothetical protein
VKKRISVSIQFNYCFCPFVNTHVEHKNINKCLVYHCHDALQLAVILNYDMERANFT